MPILKLIQDNAAKATYPLIGYSLIPMEEEIQLEIQLHDKCLRYMISCDSRERNLNDIESYIEMQLDDALVNNKMIYIREYRSRSYIFIGEDEMGRQFTANIK